MAVASPCTQLCSIDPGSGYCIGCRRTIDEIAGWAGGDDRWKRAVLKRIERRAFRKD